MRINRHGALAVVENDRAPKEITLALRKIDPRLFLEKQLTFANETVWCVVCDVGLDHPPVTLMEWRDEETDEPIPYLTDRLVGRVERMERDSGKLVDGVIRKNAELLEKRRRDSTRDYAEIWEDMEPRMRPGYSAVLHRGTYLRRSRDQQRARGEMV